MARAARASPSPPHRSRPGATQAGARTRRASLVFSRTAKERGSREVAVEPAASSRASTAYQRRTLRDIASRARASSSGSGASPPAVAATQPRQASSSGSIRAR